MVLQDAGRVAEKLALQQPPETADWLVLKVRVLNSNGTFTREEERVKRHDEITFLLFLSLSLFVLCCNGCNGRRSLLLVHTLSLSLCLFVS
jgi:hypothetical protein